MSRIGVPLSPATGDPPVQVLVGVLRRSPAHQGVRLLPQRSSDTLARGGRGGSFQNRSAVILSFPYLQIRQVLKLPSLLNLFYDVFLKKNASDACLSTHGGAVEPH